MIRLFNHYFHKRALYLICFEMGLLVFLVTAAFLYQSADPFAVKPMVLMGALWMATGVSTINTGLGFYHGSHSLTTTQVRLRAIVSLCLSLPLAYVVYRISPLPPEDAMTFLLSLITALGLMLVYRAYTAVAYPWRAVGPRVLVYGTGTNARLVGSLLLQSEPHANLVGYYASPSEPGAQTALASGWQPQGCSLTEVAAREHDKLMAYAKQSDGGSNIILTVVNLDPSNTHRGWLRFPLEQGKTYTRPLPRPEIPSH